jgi:hypothetical protein
MLNPLHVHSHRNNRAEPSSNDPAKSEYRFSAPLLMEEVADQSSANKSHVRLYQFICIMSTSDGYFAVRDCIFSRI